MSLFSMMLSPVVKELKSNPKIVGIVNDLVTSEQKIAPILAKLDKSAIAAAIATLSGGKISEAEIELLESEVGVVLEKLGVLIEEAQHVIS